MSTFREFLRIFLVFNKIYHAIILAKIHVYRHSYQNFKVYWRHMVSHDTFSPLPLQGRYGQIPTLFEIACGRDRQVPDHAMSPTSSTLKSWSIFNSFTNFSIISCDIFLIPSRTGDKGVVFVVVLSCNCGFDDMVCCWGISGTRQQM